MAIGIAGRAMAGWTVPGVEVRVVESDMQDVPREMRPSVKWLPWAITSWRATSGARSYRIRHVRSVVSHRRHGGLG